MIGLDLLLAHDTIYVWGWLACCWGLFLGGLALLPPSMLAAGPYVCFLEGPVQPTASLLFVNFLLTGVVQTCEALANSDLFVTVVTIPPLFLVSVPIL